MYAHERTVEMNDARACEVGLRLNRLLSRVEHDERVTPCPSFVRRNLPLHSHRHLALTSVLLGRRRRDGRSCMEW
jgi:hypothetical protein